MSAGIIIVVLLLLAGLGVGIYFLVNAKKCKDYETQGECKDPCKWDTYGNKCIGEDDDLTPAPPKSPTPTPSPTPTQEELTYDKVAGYPPDVNGKSGGAYGGTWYLVAAGEANDPEICRKEAELEGATNYGWRRANSSCWSYLDSTFLKTYNESTASGKTDHVIGCVQKGVKVKDGCMKPLKETNIINGYPLTGMISGHQELGEPGEKYTMRQCSDLAKEVGKTNWGYRNWSHPTHSHTCWAYNDSSELKGFKGRKADKISYMGCVDPTKKITDGCV
jgi:hypothetical protein